MTMDNAASATVQKLKDLSPKERMRAMYGKNRPIEGGYDPALSAKCNNGTFVGRKDGDILSFKGVPFAQPPVGELRWKRPSAPEPDDGVYEAYYNGRSPIQTEWVTEVASYYPQSEDCLYLNLWVNAADTSTDKTVMVFFHGGSYGWGGTADPLYDGTRFVEHNPDIIMVTAAYRTGLMGFVDLSYLKGGEDFPDAPNLGLLDQIEALRWVRDNIAAFGGDPDKVTIFGESAGGGSVSLLPVIEEAKGLFRRVIAESGSVALTFSKEECRNFTRRLIRESRITDMDRLMRLSEKQLMSLNKKLNMYNNFPQRDGQLIPLDPYAPYAEGATADVDILIGTNADESRYWVGEIGGLIPFRFSIPIKFENDLRTLSKAERLRVDRFMSILGGHSIWKMSEFYDEVMFRLPAVRQAELHNKNGGKVYMYYWTERSAIPYRGASHAVELAYVFGNTKETIFTGKPADRALSETVMSIWANFARTGDPSTGDLTWPQYDSESRLTAVLCSKPHIKGDILSEQRKLLYPLLRVMINPSYAELDYNVPFVRKAIVRSAATAAVIALTGVSVYHLFKK